MKKIFISYSKSDLALVKEFTGPLSALKLDGQLSSWYFCELAAGTGWNDETQKYFEEADIVCFMISPNFMRTKYIHEHEIARAFEKKAKDPAFKIVPVLLDFCTWHTPENDLGMFTALPWATKPVAAFHNQNTAWFIVQVCLRLMITNNLDPKGPDFYCSEQIPPSPVQKIYSVPTDNNTKQ